MICPNCGTENRDDVNQCTFCGQRLAPKNGPAYDDATANWNNSYSDPNGNQNFYQNQNMYDNQNAYQNPNQPPYGQQPQAPLNNQQPKASNGLAIASMVLALVSIIFSCFIPYLSVPMDIVAIILGIISLVKFKGASKGMAITGIIVGAIMLIFGILVIVMAIYLVSSGVYSDPSFQEYFNDIMNGNLMIHLKQFLF